MEDIISLVLTGCKLAHELESNLRRLNSTAHLLEKCEQISGAFTAASQGLRAIHCHVALHGRQPEEKLEMKIPAVEERAPAGGPIIGVGPMPASSSKGKEIRMQVPSAGLVDDGGGELRLPAPYVVKGGAAGGFSGGEGSSLQKSRKRKDETGKITIEVEAPLHGNTEIPPDDGYSWRKYGQKEILGAQFPRGYYRCTHQKLYNCPAKKQVQRLNNNPRIFQVIYRGHHICHMNSTAPAAAIPPPPPPITTAAHHDGWLSIELTSQPLISTCMSMMSAATTTTTAFYDPSFNAGTTSLNVVVGQAQGRDHQGDLGANVVDMADAMFNSSPGSGDDGIDFIFSQ